MRSVGLTNYWKYVDHREVSALSASVSAGHKTPIRSDFTAPFLIAPMANAEVANNPSPKPMMPTVSAWKINITLRRKFDMPMALSAPRCFKLSNTKA